MNIPLRPRILVSLVTVALAVGACSGSDASTNTDDPVASTPIGTAPPDDFANRDVPDDFVAPILDDVETRSGVSTDELVLLDATAVEWANQQLGCVHFDQPAEPTPVDGFRVVVDAQGVEYDYRLDADGAYELCGDPVTVLRDDPAHDEQHEDDEEPHDDEPATTDPVTS